MRRLLPALLLFAATAASARVISYAPYSDRITIPATQSRLNRHFVLLELSPGTINRGQVVVYDTQGFEEPRVVLDNVFVNSIAAREDDQQLAILVQGSTPSAATLSVDGGRTWKTLSLPASVYFTSIFSSFPDTGGPIARPLYAGARSDAAEYPFLCP